MRAARLLPLGRAGDAAAPRASSSPGKLQSLFSINRHASDSLRRRASASGSLARSVPIDADGDLMVKGLWVRAQRGRPTRTASGRSIDATSTQLRRSPPGSFREHGGVRGSFCKKRVRPVPMATNGRPSSRRGTAPAANRHRADSTARAPERLEGRLARSYSHTRATTRTGRPTRLPDADRPRLWYPNQALRDTRRSARESGRRYRGLDAHCRTWTATASPK